MRVGEARKGERTGEEGGGGREGRKGGKIGENDDGRLKVPP